MKVTIIVGNTKIICDNKLENKDSFSNKGNKIVGILVENLSTRMTKMDLMKEFKAVGEIRSIDMHVDASDFPLGSAIIKYEDVEDAVRAYEDLDGTYLDGMSMKLTILRDYQERSFLKMMHETRKKRKRHTSDVDKDLIISFQKKLTELKYQMYLSFP